MHQHPCDLCGCVVQSALGPGPRESMLCEGCLRTRRVKADARATDRTRHKKHIYKFRCLYCGRKLRSKPVQRDVRLACPACAGLLVLGPGGSIDKIESVSGVEAASGVSDGGSSDHETPLVQAHESQDPDRIAP